MALSNSARPVVASPPHLFADADVVPAKARFQTPPALWQARASVDFADRRIATQLNVSPVCAAILRARGYASAESVEAFFAPHPGLLRDESDLPDIEKCVARLIVALQNGQHIRIFGDYDVDGVTSTALVVRTLKSLKANVSWRLPERDEGYGLSVASIEEAKKLGADVLMSVDCGVTAVEPARHAREIGLDLIITDHHECGAQIPDAIAVVNPKRPDGNYGFSGLSGCGVAFKVMQALIKAYKPAALSSFEEKFVDLVALSTIADCVPLCDENRYLAWAGLQRLYNTKRKGLRALIRNAGFKDKGFYNGRDVSFGLAPRINAAGRLASPTLALRLLLCDDDAGCEELANQIEELNHSRKGTTEMAVAQASEIVERDANLNDDCIIVAAGNGWHKGVVGLIAAKLVDKYCRPAFAINVDAHHAHGSGRSCNGFDLHALLTTAHQQKLLVSGGGHAAACGVTLLPEKVPLFHGHARAYAGEKLKVSDLVPRIWADCEVEARDLNTQLAQDLARLEPCGTGNEAPVLLLKNAVLETLTPIRGDHFKGRLRLGSREFEWIWFRSAGRMGEFHREQLVDCLFVPELNTFNGRTNLQLVIRDMRASI